MTKRDKYLLVILIVTFIAIVAVLASLYLDTRPRTSTPIPQIETEYDDGLNEIQEEESYIPGGESYIQELTSGDEIEEIEQDIEGLEVDLEEIDYLETEADQL